MDLLVKLAIAGIILAPIIGGVVAHQVEERDYFPNGSGLTYAVAVMISTVVAYVCFDYLRDVYPDLLPQPRGHRFRDDDITGFAIVVGICGTTVCTGACYFIAWKWNTCSLRRHCFV